MNNEQKKAATYENLRTAEKAYEAACGCGCACHQVKVQHEGRCCFASHTLTNEIKEDLVRLHKEVRELENG